MEVSNSSTANPDSVMTCRCSCLPCRFNTAAASIACDDTTASAQAIRLKYGKTAARVLWTLYMQATFGDCKRKTSPEMTAMERHLIRNWYLLEPTIPTHAKQLFLKSLEIAISKQSDKARGSDVEPVKAEHEACSSDFRVVSGGYGRCYHNALRCPAERHRLGMPLTAVDKYPASEVDVEVAQEWAKAIWDLDDDSEFDIMDTTTEGKIEVSNHAATRDIIQMIVDQDNELTEQALVRIRENVDLCPAINSANPSVNDILKPKFLSEEAFMEMMGICIIDVCDQWIKPSVYGQRPKPRYQHGAFVLDYNMCVAGGCKDVDWYDDIQVLNLMTFTWSKIEVGTDKFALSLPAVPCSGQPLITWNDKLFAIGGHKVDHTEYITVNELNASYCTWGNVDTNGTIPKFRRGQSATIVGNNLVIFGGEDDSGIVLNDLHILDLTTMSWTDVNAIAAPSPRSNHAAACHKDQFVFIFGGQCHDTYYNELHRFDLKKREWMILQTKGKTPVARAGHAGVTIDDNWIIVGGRNRQTRFSETFVLNMSSFTWSFVAHGPSATEGMSLVSSSYEEDDFVISFGGYNDNYANEGSYNNEVSVLKLSSIWSGNITYDRCQSDSSGSESEDGESEVLLSKRKPELEDSVILLSERKELDALVSKRKQVEASVILLSERKEDLEASVSKRKQELEALVSEREEESKDSVSERKEEVEATPFIVETRKRKLLSKTELEEALFRNKQKCTARNSES